MLQSNNKSHYKMQENSEIVSGFTTNKTLYYEIEKEKILFNRVSNEQCYNKKVKCRFLDLCKICIKSDSFTCCLSRRINGEISSQACQAINCISLNDCKKAIKSELTLKDIPNVNNLLKNEYKVKNSLVDFSEYYYPIIQIERKSTLKKQIDLIKELKFQGITISLQKIFSPIEEILIKDIYVQDLHELLNYDGEIILTMNIKDRYCKILMEKSKNIPEILKILNPDVITTLDANFYLDQPSFITLLQLDKIFKINDKISNIKSKQIGLVPPIPLPFFKIALLSQLNKNHKTIAIPFQEINKYRKRYIELQQFQQKLISKIRLYYLKLKFKYILLSTSPRKGLYANSYSSMAWLSKINNFRSSLDIWALRKKNLRDYKTKAEIFRPKLRLYNFLGGI